MLVVNISIFRWDSTFDLSLEKFKDKYSVCQYISCMRCFVFCSNLKVETRMRKVIVRTLDESFLNFVSSKWTKYYGREIIIVKQVRKFNHQGDQPSRDKFIYLFKQKTWVTWI